MDVYVREVINSCLVTLMTVLTLIALITLFDCPLGQCERGYKCMFSHQLDHGVHRPDNPNNFLNNPKYSPSNLAFSENKSGTDTGNKGSISASAAPFLPSHFSSSLSSYSDPSTPISLSNPHVEEDISIMTYSGRLDDDDDDEMFRSQPSSPRLLSQPTTPERSEPKPPSNPSNPNSPSNFLGDLNQLSLSPAVKVNNGQTSSLSLSLSLPPLSPLSPLSLAL